MPVELATTIYDLDPTWPLSGDPTYQGDDHIRMIKAVLKAQFPGASGNGLNAPVLATASELTYCSGLQKNIQQSFNELDAIDRNLEAQINDLRGKLSAPSGLIMMFVGTWTPVGWVFNSNHDDCALRITGNQTLGGGGGQHSMFGHTFTHAHSTGNFALAIAHMPAHTHNVAGVGGISHPFGSVTQSVYGGQFAGPSSGYNYWNLKATSSQGGSTPHNHGNTSTDQFLFQPKYINCFLAQKA